MTENKTIGKERVLLFVLLLLLRAGDVVTMATGLNFVHFYESTLYKYVQVRY